MNTGKLLNIGTIIIISFLFLTQACASQKYQVRAEPPPSKFYLAEQQDPGIQQEAKSSVPSTLKAVPEKNALSDPEPQKTNRLMIYNAQLTLIVDNISSTLNKIRKTAESLNGYMQTMDAQSIVIKVPAVRFNKMIRKIEPLGEVTQKEINGEDVTEKMLDLNIRLKNAEALRERFVRLLSKAVNVEDIIKIEKELARTTQTIETLKGKIRYFENQIAFSTITVILNSPLPQQVIKEKIPYPWVREIGEEVAQGGSGYYDVCWYCDSPKFKLPEAFAVYEERENLTRATSADGVLIKVKKHKNVEGASPEFWTEMIKRALAIEHVIAVKKTTEAAISKKIKAHIMQGKKEIGNKTYDYFIAVVMTKKHVYTYEAWGQADVFLPRMDAIEESVKTLKVGF